MVFGDCCRRRAPATIDYDPWARSEVMIVFFKSRAFIARDLAEAPRGIYRPAQARERMSPADNLVVLQASHHNTGAYSHARRKGSHPGRRERGSNSERTILIPRDEHVHGVPISLCFATVRLILLPNFIDCRLTATVKKEMRNLVKECEP